jgi:hypothetical protein
MNRSVTYANGVVDNQIRALEHCGLFDKPVLDQHKIAASSDGADSAAYDRLPRMPSPSDARLT